MDNGVLGAITDMISYSRSHIGSEFAIRVGCFTPQGDFINGYQIEHMSLISKLRKCMQKTCQEKSNWTLEPDVLLMRADYTDKVRSTTMVLKNVKDPLVTSKTRIQRLGLTSNRIYDLLASITKEVPINPEVGSEVYKIIQRKEPISVRFIEKGVYYENVSYGDVNIKLRYEITKVSPKGPTKMASTGKPCSYNCSVTLADVCRVGAGVSQPPSLVEEKNLNGVIAKLMISRASALLGSYTLANGQLTKLENIKLDLLK